MANLVVIIPVRNRNYLTDKCLNCLMGQNYKDFKVIVVDDGSNDGTPAMIYRKYPEVDLILGDGNLWWTAAINLGIKRALKYSPNYILTLNDDLEISPKYLTNLIKCAAVNFNCLIGSVSVNIAAKNISHYAGVEIDWKKGTKKRIYKNQNISELPSVIKTDSQTGRGTLIPIEVFNKIGIFDADSFPHYAADEDFSLRAKEKGFNLIICRDCVVESHVEATGYHAGHHSSFLQYYKDLFSRKSSNNILQSNKFLFRHCNSKFLIQNVLINNFKKLIFPFYSIIKR